MKLEKFSRYNVELRNMRQDRMEYEFTLDDQFFTELEVSDIHKGNVEACLTVRKALGA